MSLFSLVDRVTSEGTNLTSALLDVPFKGILVSLLGCVHSEMFTKWGEISRSISGSGG